MSKILVERESTNRFGTFRYEPSLLENLAEYFSNQWRVEFSDLVPENRFSNLVSKYILVRDGRSEEDKTRVSYFKYGVDRVGIEASKDEPDVLKARRLEAKALYETSEPDHEYLILRKEDKQVLMRFEPNGKKEEEF